MRCYGWQVLGAVLYREYRCVRHPSYCETAEERSVSRDMEDNQPVGDLYNGLVHGAGMDRLSTAQLFSTYRSILRELKNRGVIRTTNAPTGDYAEFLIARLLGVNLAPSSEKSWDARAPDGKTLQVKSRVITNPGAVGERQLSPFRSIEFDEVAIVLFDDDYRLWRAVRIPVALAQERATFRSHVNGHILFAKDQLLDDTEATDITDALRAVAGEL